jgi:tetratricopeptide (TPR) repeat protein
MNLRTSLIAITLLAGCATVSRVDDPRSEEIIRAERRKDWPRVERLAAEWLRAEPRSYDALVSLGQALVESGRPGEAIGPLRAALKEHDWAAARLWLGRALAATGELTEAEKHLREGIRKYPRSARAPWDLADVLAAQARCGEALIVIEMGRSVHGAAWADDDRLPEWTACAGWTYPPDAVLRYGRGRRLEREGRWDEAGKEYEAVLALVPGFADCHRRLGIIAEVQGQARRAERELQAAIAGYAPAERALALDARTRLAGIILSRPDGLASEAMTLLADVARGADAPAASIITLAAACDRIEDVGCARAAFFRFLPANERSLMPAAERAKARDGVMARLSELGCPAGREGAAGPDPEDCVPQEAARRCDAGRRLLVAGKRDQAIPELRAGTEQAPAHAACWHMLAVALDDADQAGPAVAAYRRAVEAPSRALPPVLRAFAQAQLAGLLIRSGSTQAEILELARQARAVLRDDPFAVLVLGRACEVTGDKACASEAFRKVLSLEEAPAPIRARAAERLRAMGAKDVPGEPKLPGSDT